MKLLRAYVKCSGLTYSLIKFITVKSRLLEHVVCALSPFKGTNHVIIAAENLREILFSIFEPLYDIIYCLLAINLGNHVSPLSTSDKVSARSIPRLSTGIACVCHKDKGRGRARPAEGVCSSSPRRPEVTHLQLTWSYHSQIESQTAITHSGLMCVSHSMMRVSEPILDMDMANYSEVLDPTYTTLEFETMQILYNSNGEFSSAWKYIYIN